MIGNPDASPAEGQGTSKRRLVQGELETGRAHHLALFARQ